MEASEAAAASPARPQNFMDTGFFRSEPMQYLKFLIPKDCARRVLYRFGELECLHLVDQHAEHSAAQMEAKKRAILAAGIDRRLSTLEQKIVEYKLELEPLDSDLLSQAADAGQSEVLDDVDEWASGVEHQLAMHANFLKENAIAANSLREEREVLNLLIKVRKEKAHIQRSIEAENAKDSPADTESEPLILREMQGKDETVLRMISGVIPEDRVDAFERIIWRASRGKAVLKLAPEGVELLDRDSNTVILKRSFALFFIGGFLKKKALLLAQSFSATEYDVSTIADTDGRLTQISEEIENKAQMSRTTRQDIVSVLKSASTSPATDVPCPLRAHQVAVRQEIAICDALKRTRATGMDFLQLEAWCPTEDVERVNQSFTDLMVRTGLKGACELVEFDSNVKMPPTHFKVNKLTATFQGMIDTYGVPRYREANPALFTIITFPFLFGVMYGDIGHSTALIAFASYLVIFEKSFGLQQKRGELGEMLGMMFNGRYMLLLMGLFAHYAGWIYNDMFSLSVNAFGSAYSFPEGSKKAINDGHVYAFGVDPVWSQSAQDLMFYNSLKMKMSVSLGVVQMSFGVIISLFNKMHFGDTLGVFTEFIPQILFMLCLFGYMIFLIIFKWSIDWSDPAELRQPPNLIQTMMNMVLKPGQVDPKFQMYEGQGTVQAVFVLVALISVPIMLFGKPCILSMRKKPRHSEDLGEVLVDSEDSQIQHEHKSEPENEHHESEGGHGDSFGDLMIHQSIHTIEFVLGTVSNTASYLRLWALSLAHSELSKVFWDKLFVMGLKSGSWAMMFVCWAAWAGITTGVLLLMDVLECFLHALRLHWVEFQGKFFEASGYSFRPFTLKQSVDSE